MIHPRRLATLATLLFLSAFAGAGAAARAAAEPVYDVVLEDGQMIMDDGVRLAVTFYRPVPRTDGERFPALLELLPYRKDDSFHLRDYPLHMYWARHGYVSARVDVRGTGSSEGMLPPREYSQAEIDDAALIIARLAAMPWSNGKVGMWGVSWGGFNALQVALRKPPALAAVLALHASDDLFHDDVHYIDGSLHVDLYALQINHENALPAPPDYPLDEAYFRDRFDREPWLLTYLRQQQDGDFWRPGSLRFQPGKVTVPVYLIGGLLDGYRDTVPRQLSMLEGPVQGVIGPWNHAFPDDGKPGPNYGWRSVAVDWWDRWLKASGPAAGPASAAADGSFVVFLRDGHPGDAGLRSTPGAWRAFDGLPRARPLRLHPAPAGGLAEAPPADAEILRAGATEAALAYVPASGVATGNWWGEPTPDMRRDDAGSLTFTGPALDAAVTIAGMPRVSLRAAVDSDLARWVVRLEDVFPDGRVALVAGGSLNSSQRDSRLEPSGLEPGEVADYRLDLHFTTWTWKPGHRIRLAVSNASFPMLWPTPAPMTARLHLGAATYVELPVLPSGAGRPHAWPPPEPREQRPGGARTVASLPARQLVREDMLAGSTEVEWQNGWIYEIGGRRVTTRERVVYDVKRDDPARAGFLGEEGHVIEWPAAEGESAGRKVELRTRIEIRSDAEVFHVVIDREVKENGAQVRQRTWRENIRRHWQ